MTRTPQDIENELLVLQCRDGDAEAIKRLVIRWQPRFARLALRLAVDREAARDVVQEVWMAVVRHLGRLDDPARFRSWAYRIVTNKCADWKRRRTLQHRALKELTAATHTRPRASDSDGELGALRRSLSELPDEQRAILSLHYLDGMSVAEIARVLNVPAGTVKSRLFHARNRLRDALERMEK